MEQKQRFLHLACIEPTPYAEIATRLNVEPKQLSRWWEELLPERQVIAALKRRHASKKDIGMSFAEFYAWFQQQPPCCHYCGITEAEIEELLRAGNIKTKRITTRGKRLELDRKMPEPSYAVVENLVLCCYWCNNAKTDEFSADEFRLIAPAFRTVWQSRLLKVRSRSRQAPLCVDGPVC